MNADQKLQLSREWVDFVCDRMKEGIPPEDLLMAVEVVGRNAQHEHAVLDTGLVETVSVPDDVAGVFEGHPDSTYLTQRFVDLSSMMLMLGDGGPKRVLRVLQEHILVISAVFPR